MQESNEAPIFPNTIHLSTASTPNSTIPITESNLLQLPLFSSPPSLALKPFLLPSNSKTSSIPITVSFASTSNLTNNVHLDTSAPTQTPMLSKSVGITIMSHFNPSPPHSKRNRKSFSKSFECSNTDLDAGSNASFSFFFQKAELIFASFSPLTPFSRKPVLPKTLLPASPVKTSNTSPYTPNSKVNPIPFLNELKVRPTTFFGESFDSIPTPKLSPLPKFRAPTTRLPKCHSSNTFSAEDRACQGNLSSVIQIVSIYLYDQLIQSSESVLEDPELPLILDEHLHPILKSPLNKRGVLPTCEAIFRFLYSMFESAKLCSEISIFMLIYMDRFVHNTKIRVTSSSWMRMVVGALLLACKVWDDDTVWNADFCTVFSKAEVNDMNDLERYYLQSLHFNIHIDLGYYAKFYLKLHDNALRIPFFEFPSPTHLVPNKYVSKDGPLKLKLHEASTQLSEGISEDEKPKPEAAPACLPGVTPTPLPIFFMSVRRIASEPSIFK